MEAVLKDGTVLVLDDNTPNDQIRVKMQQAEQQLAAKPASQDDGQPAVVDEPNGNWLHDNHPDIYNAGHELLTGVAQGVGNLPNAVPNAVNNIQSLYDLHFGKGTGEVAPEDQWQQWMAPEDYPAGPTLEQLNPQTPGYEGIRQYGQMTGSALPFGPVAALVAPALSEGGGFVGDIVDQATGNTDTHKWQQTLATATPTILGAVRAPLAALERSGMTPGVTSTAVASMINPKLAALMGTLKGAANVAKKTSHGSLADDLAASIRTQGATLPFDNRRP